MSASLALIGAGYWGRNLARNFHELGALRAIVDADAERLADYAERYPDVAGHADLAAVLADPAVTRVAIATPAVTHAEVAERCLRAGRDVFVEKPLALDLSDARRLIELARAHERILMVGHLLQYHPAVERLLDLARTGELGQLRSITSNRLNLGRIRTEENALWSFAPHDFSVILALAGGEPEQVRCTGASHLTAGVADTTLTALSFAGGLHAHVYVSWLNPFKEQRLTVVGERALAVFDDTRDWADKLTLFRQPVRYGTGRIPRAQKPEPEPVACAEAEPLRAECAHFLHCCDTRTPPRTDGDEGLRVLALLDAAQRSLVSGGEATVPESESAYQAHPTAVVDPGARVGAGTRIWHFCHLCADCDIGPECSLGQNCFVAPGVKLGAGCKVQNNVSLYTGVECGRGVFLGPSMVFTNVVNPRAEVSRRDEYRTTRLGDGVTVGANATLLCGISIGAYAFVGAGATVTRDVPAHALVVGSPARVVGWMSRHGERLELPAVADGVHEATCPATGEAYRLDADGCRARA